MSDVGGLAEGIREALGIDTSARPPDQISYARDLWPRHHVEVRAGRIAEHMPAAIAWPTNSEQVAALMDFCGREGVNTVPFGAGSGVCGGVLPTDQSLVIDLKRMKRWREFAPEQGYLDVEAGALGIRLEEDLQRRGYTVGHFPSSILCSTVGGWVAARGAGQCSGLYGKIEDMTAALECVDGRGEIATLRRRLGGPDLTPLITGSEGVLAVITSARLRLHPVPEHRGYAAYSLSSMQAGWETIRAIYQRGLRPAVCRLYDPFDSMMARRSAGKKAGATPSPAESRSQEVGWLSSLVTRQALRFPGPLNAAIDALGTRAFGGAMLVLLFEGQRDRNVAELASADELVRAAGGEALGEAPARHWLSHRYSVSYRQAPMYMMGNFVDTMEVAAPWSRLEQLYADVRAALGEHVMVMAHMSHAYPDGCSIYFTFAGSAGDDDEALEIYDRAWNDAMTACIAAGGALSHHHGVGRSKAPQMGAELNAGIELLAAVKKALDPNDVLNPGCLMPAKTPLRQGLPPTPKTPVVDLLSQTVHVAGSHALADVETALEPHNLSLSLADGVDMSASVASWLGDGSPGAPDPWEDPVDHMVAGYDVELACRAALHVRPCPRRAVGPDLWSLFHGTAGRAGRIDAVHLRARGSTPPALSTPLARAPAIDAAEQQWIDRALDAAASLR